MRICEINYSRSLLLQSKGCFEQFIANQFYSGSMVLVQSETYLKKLKLDYLSIHLWNLPSNRIRILLYIFLKCLGFVLFID